MQYSSSLYINLNIKMNINFNFNLNMNGKEKMNEETDVRKERWAFNSSPNLQAFKQFDRTGCCRL